MPISLSSCSVLLSRVFAAPASLLFCFLGAHFLLASLFLSMCLLLNDGTLHNWTNWIVGLICTCFVSTFVPSLTISAVTRLLIYRFVHCRSVYWILLSVTYSLSSLLSLSLLPYYQSQLFFNRLGQYELDQYRPGKALSMFDDLQGVSVLGIWWLMIANLGVLVAALWYFRYVYLI